MRRRSVVPWWGRVLPWACTIGAVMLWSWALDIDGWKLITFCFGIELWAAGYRITEANVEADR